MIYHPARYSGLGYRIVNLLRDPGIQHPQFAKNYYYDYKRLAELVQAMEEGPVLALGRFSTEDRMVTMLVQRICDEAGYPFDKPLCSARLRRNTTWRTRLR
jgi:hypothetical protein